MLKCMTSVVATPRVAYLTTCMAACLTLAVTCGCGHVDRYADRGLVAPVSPSSEKSLYRVLLVGDAGEPGPEATALVALRAWVDDVPDRTLVTFLGDNAYPDGLTRAHRHEAEQSLLRQLQVVEDTPATALFIPGNHDWTDGGPEGLDAVLAQAAFLRDRAAFLPSNGCPGPELMDVPVAEPLLRIIALDTQWWLQDDRQRAGACEPGTRASVGDALRTALDTTLPVVVAAHHPLASHGPHGGFFDWRAHVFPLTHAVPWLWVPLPIVGSIYPLMRTRVMPSEQELSSAENRDMRDALSEALASRTRRGPVLYAAGHEHSLQVLRGDVVDYVLVSGAGSEGKITAVGSGPDTLFAHAHTGFIALDVSATAIRVSVVEPTETAGNEVAYSLELPLSAN